MELEGVRNNLLAARNSEHLLFHIQLCVCYRNSLMILVRTKCGADCFLKLE